LNPTCPRYLFGKSWLDLYDGDINGLAHIEAGRAIGNLGDPRLSQIRGRRWDGIASLHGKTVVFYCEGGQGDQMMAMRSAQRLQARGAIVVVACQKSLTSLARRMPGVSAVIESEAINALTYDYYVPGLSSFRLCGATWDNLWAGPYLSARDPQGLWARIIPRDKLNVGIRWSGLPDFEHEQLRRFPPSLMFDAVNVPGVRLYSLQKDDPQPDLPETVTDLEPLLGDWEQTAAAIQQLDLVITSCTSIAHLAAAMGKPTFVVVPAMPYYPWARPGNKSQWYPNVTLFRQRCYGQWEQPFKELHDALCNYQQ
jgi:hypothetical protein